METTLSSDSKLPQQLSTIELKTDKTTRYKLMHNLLLCFSFFLRDSWRVLLLSQIHHITANSSSIERFLQVQVLQIPGYWIINKSLEVNEKTKDSTEMPKWRPNNLYYVTPSSLFFSFFMIICKSNYGIWSIPYRQNYDGIVRKKKDKQFHN